MLTVVAAGHRVLVDAVAQSIADAEEARVMRRDATAMVERMAAQARAAGVVHPVAAAVARGARVSELIGPEEFAERHGLSVPELLAAEAGDTRFGELPSGYDRVLAALGLDLLSLADLAASWQQPASAQETLF
ncbi:MAG: hypothetical protein R2707_19315 [Acidimicrobiales bacterium]